MKEFLLTLNPSLIVFVGAVLCAIGAYLSTLQDGKFQNELKKHQEEVIKLSSQVIAEQERVIELSESALFSTTGGNSFCHVRHSGPQGQLVVINDQKYPVYDVSARIVDLDKVDTFASTDPQRLDPLIGINVNIGNLTPGFARPIMTWRETKANQLRLNIFFVARNGGYIELYRRIKVGDGYATAMQITMNGKVVKEDVSPDFPVNSNGEVDWSG